MVCVMFAAASYACRGGVPPRHDTGSADIAVATADAQDSRFADIGKPHEDSDHNIASGADTICGNEPCGQSFHEGPAVNQGFLVNCCEQEVRIHWLRISGDSRAWVKAVDMDQTFRLSVLYSSFGRADAESYEAGAEFDLGLWISSNRPFEVVFGCSSIRPALPQSSHVLVQFLRNDFGAPDDLAASFRFDCE